MSKTTPAKIAEHEQNPQTQIEKSVVAHSYYSGPIPHPALLNKYDPETRKIIVSMAERQSLHRQSIEASVIASNIWNERAGMFIAAALTFFMIGGGIYLLMNNKNAVGLFLVFGTSVFHAGNYIYNKTKENEVKKQKIDHTNDKG